ncbi:hypothetical protein PAS25_13580 [Leclercia adecarboxylata]|uniref:hypothetical protein n=1 Tax=Leclercia adecarboxylata TaxID=83655 RepID=UPI00111BCAC2|nr:hypothetical protein [Leclercia adecarboxylata]QCZ29744.1 hypothetical protein FHN83_25230 [Leclercia adecarboxylata]
MRLSMCMAVAKPVRIAPGKMRSLMERGRGRCSAVAIIKNIARKIGKFIYFVFLLMCVGHSLPYAELYINEDFATKWALFFYGSEDAESLYEAFFDIDLSVMLSIAIPVYILTMKLIKKLRRK